MKLEENQKTLNAGEGLSLEEIYERGCRSHFQGRVEAGNAYFSQLKPSDGEIYIRAYGFLSQVLSFRRDYDLALECAQGLLSYFPDHPLALHFAGLVHCYRQEYNEAGILLSSYAPKPNRKGGDYYQAACILAGRGDYEPALMALDISFQNGGNRYGQKLWYDPELVLLWDALPSIAETPSIRACLSNPIWQKILGDYDPDALFDELDPGNLRSLSIEEMHFIGVHCYAGPMAFLITGRAKDAPEVYASLLSRLKGRRHRSMVNLGIALCQVHAVPPLESLKALKSKSSNEN
jgi:tetratricopeptide (TPR) repeat protein|tara:strand:+ start:437 stop:1312 length:876 start_codon:yes stop_codon:yes gene_type:complete